ncbi:hypothetical protein [Aquibium sp. ELW1220]|jgi:hypothetical protein|uniref:hypothetical protein n=1 Tax=Aquibium sp. ELW1220 TaxID=2976766 RepID=UPI0025B246CB|nr:hypothetical protein [Aquibium sp. ELW1220]MDN2583686.1 hypothetical protein [Aquibium sp. ELW1220]
MSRRFHRLAFAGLLAAAGAMMAAAPAAASERYPNSGGGRDMVSGYLCVGTDCDTLRLPGTDCLCTKDNPAQMDFRKLELTCVRKENRKWVACPIQPRPGEVIRGN